MSTKSFTNTIYIEHEDVETLYKIMNDKSTEVKYQQVLNHQEVKGKDILDMLSIKENDI
ncbi:MAG: hypothetical protein LUG60_01370 [Erysipelotrichaceae bacterium]|nr:hypothetical protein [Erysipelotrichaceae bacterium]